MENRHLKFVLDLCRNCEKSDTPKITSSFPMLCLYMYQQHFKSTIYVNSKSIVHFNVMLLHAFSTVYSPCYTDVIFLGDKSFP